MLAINEVKLNPYIIIYTGKVQTLPDTLVRILQVVFSNQSDVHFLRGMTLFVEKRMPCVHGRCLSYGDMHLAQNSGIETLTLHADGHLVDAGHILTLYDTFQINIAERGYLHAQGVVEVLLGAQDEDIGLDTHRLQLLHAVLRGLCLQFSRSLQVRHIGEMYTYGITS